MPSPLTAVTVGAAAAGPADTFSADFGLDDSLYQAVKAYSSEINQATSTPSRRRESIRVANLAGSGRIKASD